MGGKAVEMFTQDLIKTKTFWGGIAGLVAAAGAYFTGDIDVGQAIQMVVTSLLAIFLRDGIKKGS